jgi:hypothetical protein
LEAIEMMVIEQLITTNDADDKGATTTMLRQVGHLITPDIPPLG